MSTTPDAAPKRRRWLPRYSLRSLFIFVALVAVALAWWVRPYEEEIGGGTFRGDHGLYRGEREVRTVRRNLSGPPIQHGPTTTYDGDGRKVRETHWSNGLKNGPELVWGLTGQLLNQGQWLHGQKDGTWFSWKPDGSFPEDLLDHSDFMPGMGGFYYRTIRAEQCEYEQGKLVRVTRFPLSNTGPFGPDPSRAEIEIVERGASADDGILKRSLAYYLLPHGGDSIQTVEQVHFRKDLREGIAEGWSFFGKRRYAGQWRAGKPDGRWSFWDEHGEPILSLTFRAGTVIAIDQREIDSFIVHLPKDGPDGRHYVMLGRLGDVIQERQLSECKSLPQWVDRVANAHNLDIGIDYRIWSERPPRGARMPDAANDPSRKFSGGKDFLPYGSDLRGVPLGAAICLVVDAYKLTCVERFGQLWITTIESGQQWQDRTGVSSLDPPSGSRVESAMGQPTTMEFEETPLSDVAEYIKDFHEIPVEVDWQDGVDPDQHAADVPIRFECKACTLRDALGAMLDQNSLSCAIDGDRLVIRPRHIDENDER